MEALDGMGSTPLCRRCGNALTTYYDRERTHGANRPQDARLAAFLAGSVTGTPVAWARTVCAHCDKPIWEQLDAEEASIPVWVRVAFVLIVAAALLALLLGRF